MLNMICSIHIEHIQHHIRMFARYAEYDMFYTNLRCTYINDRFARYAEYDMFYTHSDGAKRLLAFARYAEYDMFYTISTMCQVVSTVC